MAGGENFAEDDLRCYKNMAWRAGSSGSSASASGAKYGTLSSPADLGVTGRFGDAIYTAEIVLGGQNFTVVIDTGSTDLWVDARGLNIQLSNNTDIPINFTYAMGGVSGNIAFADLQIGPYTIPNQAFVNATEVDDFPGGIRGLIGMAFDNAALYSELFHHWGSESANRLGRAPITNLFTQNPSAPGFFDLELSREDITGVERDGHFFFGQHAPEMQSALQKAPKIERVQALHWTLAMDGMKINGKPFTAWNKSVIPGLPQGQVAVPLDSGFTYPQIPDAVVHAIYSSIPGAVFYPGNIPGIDNGPSGTNWVVPCNASANISFTFGGQDYPVHPRDLLEEYDGVKIDTVDGVDVVANGTVCINRYQSGVGDETYDMILGMAFLRNVYASFNYGNYTPPGVNITGQQPFVQMVPVIDPAQAWADFNNYTTQKLLTSPPLVDPASFVKLLNDFSGLSASAGSGSVSSGGSGSNNATVAGDLAVSGAASQSDSGSDKDSNKYAPLAVGLLGANVAIGLVILGVTLAICMRGSRGSKESRYKPLRLPKEDAGMDPEHGPLYSDA
ncbi:acid protease [Trametes sanguinea]|nr:acid protease [Trametes sanguinea]